MRHASIASAALFLALTAALGQEGRLLVKRNAADPSRQDCDVMIATFTTPKDWAAHPSGKNSYAILTRAREQQPNLNCLIYDRPRQTETADAEENTPPTTSRKSGRAAWRSSR